MFRKHVIALALLAIAGTSGAALAAEQPTHSAKQRYAIAAPSGPAAEVNRFFNGNPPEGWPYSSD
jgi:hypothetical protein